MVELLYDLVNYELRGTTVKLLLHCCCAPCSLACIKSLGEESTEPNAKAELNTKLDLALFWYNPNIHPFTEYKSRRDTLVQYAKKLGLKLIMEGITGASDKMDDYGLRSFIQGLSAAGSLPRAGKADASEKISRCAFCYRMRLEKTAMAAKEGGFDAFSTTLLISPYQNHELLKKTAEEAALRYGTEFLYRDFRPLFREGQTKARAEGFYMQKYCGCIFSEEERYLRS
jgi:predicted adenine nucleotide alpha hydrolase (AANH) superfamily ATPase